VSCLGLFLFDSVACRFSRLRYMCGYSCESSECSLCLSNYCLFVFPVSVTYGSIADVILKLRFKRFKKWITQEKAGNVSTTIHRRDHIKNKLNKQGNLNTWIKKGNSWTEWQIKWVTKETKVAGNWEQRRQETAWVQIKSEN